jgi:hypothetical protein
VAAESVVPAWMKYVTFAAWLVALFVPPPYVSADAKPYVSGVFTLMVGGTVATDFMHGLRRSE